MCGSVRLPYGTGELGVWLVISFGLDFRPHGIVQPERGVLPLGDGAADFCGTEGEKRGVRQFDSRGE